MDADSVRFTYELGGIVTSNERRVFRRAFGLITGFCVAGLFAVPASAGVGEPTADISLTSTRRFITYGDATTLSGQVTSSLEACAEGAEVVIYSDYWDDIVYDWNEMGRVTTDQDGRFSLVVEPDRTVSYRAELTAANPCGSAKSNVRRVRVRFKVEAASEEGHVPRGERAHIRVVVKPSGPLEATDAKVILKKFNGEKFVRVAARAPSEGGIVEFSPRIQSKSIFRATVPRVDTLASVHFFGRSKRVVVGVI